MYGIDREADESEELARVNTRSNDRQESLTHATTKTRVLDLSRSTDRTFVHLLVNTLLVSVINFTVWFAVTFWVFLETKSVLATGMVAGIFLVTTAVSGIWFGSLVDHYRKKTVMQVSAVVSLDRSTPWRSRCTS